MRPASLLLLPLALSLAACGSRGVRAPDTYDLSGTLGGDWGASPRLRLSLVGTGFPKALTNDGNQPQNVVETGQNTWAFGFDLPSVPSAAGAYQVIAYDDRDGSGTYSLGEPFARNRQWLIYSLIGGTSPAFILNGEEILPAMTVERGWNLYDRRESLSAANPRAVAKVTGYQISR